MKGFNLSTGITVTSFKSRKSKKTDEGPSPEPNIDTESKSN